MKECPVLSNKNTSSIEAKRRPQAPKAERANNILPDIDISLIREFENAPKTTRFVLTSEKATSDNSTRDQKSRPIPDSGWLF